MYCFPLHQPISLGKASRARADCTQSKHSRELLLMLGGLGSFIIEAFVTTLLSQHALDPD